MESVGLIVVLLLGGGLGFWFYSLIGAVFLRAAAHWAEKLEIPFGAARTTVLLSLLIAFAIGLPVAFMFSAIGLGEWTTQVFVVAVQFVALSMIIAKREKLSFSKAARIAGCMMVIGLSIGILIAGFAFVVTQFSRLG
ncbi:MAG: hypothetical protein AB7U20_11505 [Planctomycetaceae bacterium]